MSSKRVVIIDYDGIDMSVIKRVHAPLTGPHWDAAERLHGRLRVSRTLISVEVRSHA